MVESPLPNPGEIVAGKYRIDSVIGQGGMGVVLGAFDQSLGRQVAIKFLHPSRAANEAAATRFGREARAAASLQSEHVVRVHEVGALPNGAPFIVMEHLAGQDLAHVVQQRGGLPLDFACDLVLQTCEALTQAHARGIVHRDLKPQNLFLTQRTDGSPCVKVLDFGISKAADTDEASSPKLTSTDMVMGTPLYMSPEQVRSLKNVDSRADIWALGAILFELLAATPPFDGPSASALHAAIAMDAPASLRTRRPDVPQHIEAVILRCLEKDPARRFQNVQELGAAIAPFATERGRQSIGNLGASGSSPRFVTSPAPPAGGFGAASTMDVRSSWQQATIPQGAPPKSRTGLIIGLAIGGFLLFIVGLSAVVGFFMLRAPVTVTQTAGPTAVSVSAVPIVPDPPAPVPAAPTTPTPIAAATKDAGAPAVKPVAVKDAGPPAPPAEDPDQATARSMAASCNHFEMMMSMAKTPDEKKHAAEQGRDFNCVQKPAIRCQRQVCREACFALDDQLCKMRLQQMERDFPAKY